MIGHRLLTSLVLVGAALPTLVGAQPATSDTFGVRLLKTANAGEIWEQTTEFGGGIAGAPRSHASLMCIEKGSFVPPMEEDEEGDCKPVDLRRSGSKVTWRMVCPDGPTGEGEMTWQGDTYTGSAKLGPAGMAMTTRFHGRKLGGGCDPTGDTRETEERKKQNDAMKQMSPAQLSRTCDQWAQRLNPVLFVYDECKAYRDVFVRRLSTPRAFSFVMKDLGIVGGFPLPPPNEIFDACGTTQQAILSRICPESLNGLQPKESLETQERLRFIVRWCPDQSRQLAQRECAGRQPCKVISHGEDGDETVCGANTFARWIYDFCEGHGSGAHAGGAKPASKKSPPGTSSAASGGGSAASDGSGAQASSGNPKPQKENPEKENPPTDNKMKQDLIKQGKKIFGL